jgi:hypothetical protein
MDKEIVQLFLGVLETKNTEIQEQAEELLRGHMNKMERKARETDLQRIRELEQELEYKRMLVDRLQKDKTELEDEILALYEDNVNLREEADNQKSPVKVTKKGRPRKQKN